MTEVDLPALEAAIPAVDGVAAMHGGRYGTVASYLPGPRVTGLRIEDGKVDVHLALYEGQNMAPVAESVRRELTRIVGCDSKSVVITIEDLAPYPIDATNDQENS